MLGLDGGPVQEGMATSLGERENQQNGPGRGGGIMDRSVVRKQENLRLVPIERTPDELAQLELVEAVNRLRVRTKKPRRFHKLAAGELYPVRLLGRLADDAVSAGCSEAEFIQSIMPVIGNLIRRKFRKTHRAPLAA